MTHNEYMKIRRQNPEWKEERSKLMKARRRNEDYREATRKRQQQLHRRVKQKEYREEHKSQTKLKRSTLEFKTKHNARLKKPERRAKSWEYIKNRRKNDPQYYLDYLMSGHIKRALKNGKNGNSWEKLVGYTAEDLKTHLEKLFLPGMTWANGKWHIDHVRPKSLFAYTDASDSEFKQCWALANLQPLWGKDNLAKGNRFTK